MYLYLPTETTEDPVLQVPSDEHLDILAVYALAQKGISTQIGMNPVSTQPNEMIETAFADEGVSTRNGLLQQYADRELFQEFPTGAPNIYRPRLDEASLDEASATILDCALFSAIDSMTDGELVVTDAPDYELAAFEVRLVRVGDEWKVDGIFSGEDACT